jgi:hypothetical protein
MIIQIAKKKFMKIFSIKEIYFDFDFDLRKINMIYIKLNLMLNDKILKHLIFMFILY